MTGDCGRPPVKTRLHGRVGPMALTIGLILGTAAPALAEDEQGRFYLGLRAIGSVAQIDSVGASGFTGSTLVENDSDVVGGLAGVYGYALGKLPLRVELEVAHRFRFDLDVRDQGPPVIDNEVNLATTSALVNMIGEWRNTSDFTPFAGAGIGWARNSTETQRTNLGTQAKTEHDNDEDNFAWSGLAGVDWAFSDNWVAEFAYRYINLGDVDTGLSAAGDTITSDDYTSHDILLSVFYRF